MAGYTCHAVLPWRSIELFAKDSGSRIFTIQSGMCTPSMDTRSRHHRSHLHHPSLTTREAAVRVARRRSDGGCTAQKPLCERAASRLTRAPPRAASEEGGSRRGRCARRQVRLWRQAQQTRFRTELAASRYVGQPVQGRGPRHAHKLRSNKNDRLTGTCTASPQGPSST